MHGTYGEDGSLQGLFEMMNIPYVGCDVLASAITWIKSPLKWFCRAHRIKVLDYFWFYAQDGSQLKIILYLILKPNLIIL